MEWKLSNRSAPEARALADRHYSRQKVGSRSIAPSGSCMVLVTRDAKAVWVTFNPKKEYVFHKFAGAWLCSMFRNEGPTLSSTLIREALACTRWYYGEPPELGMVTFVDPEKIANKQDPGWCFLRAKFKYIHADNSDELYKTPRGLIALGITANKMPVPCAPDLSDTPLCTIMTALNIAMARRTI